MNSISFLSSSTTCINYTLISTINQKENTNISSPQIMLLVPKHHSCLTWRRRTFINKERTSPSITTPHTDLIPVIGWYTLSQSRYTPHGDTNEDLYITGSTSSITDNLRVSGGKCCSCGSNWYSPRTSRSYSLLECAITKVLQFLALKSGFKVYWEIPLI